MPFSRIDISCLYMVVSTQLNKLKTVKERMLPELLQRAAVCCEAVHEWQLTASGVGFVKGLVLK